MPETPPEIITLDRLGKSAYSLWRRITDSEKAASALADLFVKSAMSAEEFASAVAEGRRLAVETIEAQLVEVDRLLTAYSEHALADIIESIHRQPIAESTSRLDDTVGGVAVRVVP